MNKLKGILTYLLLLSSLSIFAQNTVDTLSPDITISGDCGYYTVNITENNIGDVGDNPRQVDRGVSHLPILDESSYNFKNIIADSNFVEGKPNYNFNIFLEVDNKFEKAEAVFAIYDDANPSNIIYKTIKYNPNKISFSKNKINFNQVRVNSFKEELITFTNRSLYPFDIDSVYLIINDVFSLYNLKFQDLKPFAPNKVSDFFVSYRPTDEIENFEDFDRDTLIIKTECLEYKIPVSGQGVEPKIIVQDHNFGWHFKGDLICKYPYKFPDYEEGLLIINPGSDTLKIYDFHHYNDNSPLTLSNPTVPEIPLLSIAPGDTSEISKLCFNPTERGEFKNRIYFHSNANGPDSVCNTNGIAFNYGPYFTDYYFKNTRVGDTIQAIIEFKNNGEIPVSIKEFYIEQNENNYRIIEDEIFPKIPDNGELTVYPEDYQDEHVIKKVQIPIEFSPKTEFHKKSKIRVNFAEELRNDTSDVYNYLYGYAELPKAEIKGYIFTPSVMINSFHPDTGKIIIRNKSYSGELRIKKVEIVDYLSNTDNFILTENLPENLVIKRNSSKEIDILFKPTNSGEKNIAFKITHDGGKYSDNQYKDTIVFVKGTGHKNLEIPTELTFDEILHCENASKRIPIKNLSKNDTLYIQNIEILNNKDLVFSSDTNKLKIDPDSLGYINISFNPSFGDKNYYYSYLRLHNDNDIHNINLTGRSKQIEIIFTLDTLRNISPGIQTKKYPNTNISDDLEIKIYSKNWEQANIDTINIQIHYLHNALRFTDIINEGDFEFDLLMFNDKILNDSLSQLEITIVNKNKIKKDGILFKPVFEVLLGSRIKYQNYFGEINLFSRNKCIKPITKSGLITLNACNIDIRRVLTNPHLYKGLMIKPNPAGNQEVEISYSIGIEFYTSIEIFNSNGILIDKLINKKQKIGEHSIILDTSKYPSGTYTIKLISGPFSDTEKLIIVK